MGINNRGRCVRDCRDSFIIGGIVWDRGLIDYRCVRDCRGSFIIGGILWDGDFLLIIEVETNKRSRSSRHPVATRFCDI